ncbi:hypothetical protein JMN32_20895 [Fulvivirga sp. 29W222]|uniref:Uncharacterized protein n=1 Tax=Fulvivirga marina TaxID=2494733 RepID=A0A937G1I7_9BACT|nr:hypothetical protein [Fulvivirga marina]MBL6448783.1 hypothetical protein [Fulvivirga marina]
MISVTSATDKYIVQPSLLDKHRKTLEWLSATLLWKQELAFFQKLLDQNASKFTEIEDKKQIDHFQNLIIYYSGELIDTLRSKLRDHEKQLAGMLGARNESRIEYFKEHNEIMNELEAFNKSFIEYKEDFFHFIERVL